MRQAVSTGMALAGNGPYSQAIVAGDYLYVSGQGPLDSTGDIVPGSIEEQTKLTLQNIREIVEAGGFTMDQVVKVGVYLSDLQHFQRFNEAYVTFFQAPMPARTCIEAGLNGILVEIDAIAYRQQVETKASL